MKKSTFLLGIPLLLWPATARAHCPLCTVGAGGAAVLAAWLGVSMLSIGVFIGAFALAMGLWMLKLLKKKWAHPPRPAAIAFVLVIFLSTILPLLPLMPGYSTFSIFWTGEYGSWLNRTYLFNSFLIGSFIGAALLYVGPFLSQKITDWRHGKRLPFQGMLLIFGLLSLTTTLFELL